MDNRERVTTPICDFVRHYAESNPARLHMPGHKGKGILGVEELDITEIDGADSLFHASGIIEESEKNASRIFGARTFYSTEGSSLCIRAMVYLARLKGARRIVATRNAHKTFISACALMNIEVVWLYPRENSLLSCDFDPNELESALKRGNADCVYITSPDYLGSVADIKTASSICKRYNRLLLVDNAHGAYLKLLPESLHPIDLGADICCDSAHKTLPVLTGGAYLQVSKHNAFFVENAKNALSLFASTSPSYLILQSLDAANAAIESFKASLLGFIPTVEEYKSRLAESGYTLIGDELLKLTINTKKYGYFGQEFAKTLKEYSIIPEFYDNDHIVFMLSPTDEASLRRLCDLLLSIERRESIDLSPPAIPRGACAVSMHDALYLEGEVIDAKDSLDRVFASFNVACPPAVPCVTLGERIGIDAIKCFEYYGIEKIRVLKDKNI